MRADETDSRCRVGEENNNKWKNSHEKLCKHGVRQRKSKASYQREVRHNANEMKPQIFMSQNGLGQTLAPCRNDSKVI